MTPYIKLLVFTLTEKGYLMKKNTGVGENCSTFHLILLLLCFKTVFLLLKCCWKLFFYFHGMLGHL